jgi:uncharacterized protein (DUF4415 family)
MKKEYDFSGAKRGAVIKQRGKTRITIFIDDDILATFRRRAEASGLGYQTTINQVLREYVGGSVHPLDARTLRKILREELKRTG